MEQCIVLWSLKVKFTGKLYLIGDVLNPESGGIGSSYNKISIEKTFQKSTSTTLGSTHLYQPEVSTRLGMGGWVGIPAIWPSRLSVSSCTPS